MASERCQHSALRRGLWHQRFRLVGNIGAGALLSFFLEEIGPLVYNQAVAQVQERLQARVQELDIEFNEEEFQYWRRRQAAAKPKRQTRSAPTLRSGPCHPAEAPHRPPRFEPLTQPCPAGGIAAGSIQSAAHMCPSGSARSRVYMKP